MPAYGVVQTSRLLSIPKSTISRWRQGWRTANGWQDPLLPAEHSNLSFQDLAELSVVSQLRTAGIPVAIIQQAATMIVSITGHERWPFLKGVVIDPEGRDILVDVMHRLVSVRRRNQTVAADVLDVRRINPSRVRIENGVAVRVFPLSREKLEEDPQMVAIDPRHRFGKPVTSRTLLDIEGLALRLAWGESFDELSEDLEPEGGVEELEEGVRYWFKTLSPARVANAWVVAADELDRFMDGRSIAHLGRSRRRSMTKMLGLAVSRALG